jgi:hypothetical protein
MVIYQCTIFQRCVELGGGKEQRILRRPNVWALIGAKRCTARNFTKGRKAIENV